MNDEEREALYRAAMDAMSARRRGERCPACNLYHSALSECPTGAIPGEENLPPLARTSDVETSHEAAAAGDKRALRFIVLGLYEQHPEGLVDDDLAIYAGYSGGHESYRRRGSDLRALGWTEWLMEPRPTTGVAPDPNPGEVVPVRRKTSLGSTARVSVITPLGRKVWNDRG